ncbi:unnamed protein product [Bemisia tabaci]|uniref:Uncharacterized protein n=1 Tax=Bemisia tabaci TaxID=7038 RepID=A0A9P0A1F6_BEMTA|nr:unnamed protein product [Bemisia tabaci]
MPASLYPEMDSSVDSRALQVAFELSLMSMKDTSAITPTNISDLEPTLTSQLQNLISAPEETRNKKSQNMTECVPVPSSEHVAEIVGRQELDVMNSAVLRSSAASVVILKPHLSPSSPLGFLKCHTVNSDEKL